MSHPSPADDGDAPKPGALKDNITTEPAQNDAISDLSNFSHRMHGLRRWRDELTAAISDYQNWVEKQGYTDGAEDLRVYEIIESLKSDKLIIALVAEFSRGKSELLNAIFFSDLKQRLLPSTAGRTTMCPTELRYDEKDGPCVKLLPIETRKTTTTISEYKLTPVHWTTLHILKPNSAEEVKEAFKEVTRTKRVNAREAQELGLYDPESKDEGSSQPENGMIEVPVWRHAIINFPHPLLKQGLVILDTPGLNALGSEPELTLNMLPGAHAILFLLAADTGVTKTDMDVWQNHVRSVISTKGKNSIVVLNKIDSLWDDLYDEEKISKTIKSQVEETAHILKVDPSSIFPVSAQKGLLAKVKNDPALLDRSGLLLLEERLADNLVPAKHEIIRNRIIYEISGRVESSRAVLNSKLATINKQLSELKRLGVKNLDVIQKMVSRMRKEKEKYDKELKGFKMTHAVLSQQAKTLLGYLSMGSMDEVIRKTRSEMNESWTTRGLKSGMTTFFSGSLARMELVSKKAGEIKSIVDGIYTKLHTEYGLAKIQPAKLALLPYLMEFKRLEKEAEAFRKSPATLMTEQHFIIKKFFITLVSQARHIFQECNNSSKSWFQAIVNPVFVQIREHKALIDQNLDALKKIHKNMDHLGDRIAELESTKTDLEEQLKTIDGLLERIHQPIS